MYDVNAALGCLASTNSTRTTQLDCEVIVASMQFSYTAHIAADCLGASSSVHHGAAASAWCRVDPFLSLTHWLTDSRSQTQPIFRLWPSAVNQPASQRYNSWRLTAARLVPKGLDFWAHSTTKTQGVLQNRISVCCNHREGDDGWSWWHSVYTRRWMQIYHCTDKQSINLVGPIEKGKGGPALQRIILKVTLHYVTATGFSKIILDERLEMSHDEKWTKLCKLSYSD